MKTRTIVDDLQDVRPDIGDDLSRSVEAALSNEGLLAHDYIEPSEFVRNNFAESGLDDESDERAEERVRDHVARALEAVLPGQAYGDLQHLARLRQLAGRAFYDTGAALSRLGRGGVFNGRMPYGSVFGPQDLTEDEFNFGRGGLDGTYFSDLRNISGRGRLISAPVLASDPGGAGDTGDEAEAVDPEDEPGAKIEVSGTLRIYNREVFDRDEDQPLRVYDLSETSKEYTIVGKFHSNSSVLLLEENNVFRFWVDLRDPDAVFQIHENDLGRIPTIDERGQVIQAPEQVTAPAADQAQAQRAILEQQYGVLLDSHRVDESGNKVMWSEEAIASVLDAVEVTADALWSIRDQLAWYATPNDKAELFRDAFGRVKILLPDETSNYKAETVAAEQGPDGSWDNTYNVIKSYDPGWENRGDWFEFNLVHEFAHVLGNRVGGEFPGDRVVILNGQYLHVPGFDDLGWGEASGPNWADTREEIWNRREPEVARQAAPELDGPNEEWADMFLFWTYEQAGQVIFSSNYLGDARRTFMSRNMPRILNARYRIRLSPEEMVELAGWDEYVDPEEDLYLPPATAREDNFADAEIRQHLKDPVNLDPRHLNRDPMVVAGKLTDGELTTIFGRSHNLPYLLHKTANGEVGWTHMELFDLSEVNVEDLLLLPNDARKTLIEPQAED
ncbi:MAG: hypothetical protein OXG39_06695 [Chloroflexi bacterium]|nr:hypothetical protein [Chloroflexota bacterium]